MPIVFETPFDIHDVNNTLLSLLREKRGMQGIE